MGQGFLHDYFDAFLNVALHVAYFVVEGRIDLVGLSIRLIYIPVADFAIVATRNHIRRSLIVKHQTTVVVPGQQDRATRITARVSLIDSLVALSRQMHIVLVDVAHTFLTHQ